MSVNDVKEKILASALELFSMKGYTATSIDEIAASAGMKGPNIYKYFKGKRAIFDELSSIMEDKYREGMRLRPVFEKMVNSKEDLKSFSMRQIQYTLSDRTIRKFRKVCTIEQFRDDLLKSQTNKYQFHNIHDQYTGIFAALIKKGLLPEQDPEMIALEYFAPVSLLIQMCDREPSREQEVVEKCERFIDYFIENKFPNN